MFYTEKKKMSSNFNPYINDIDVGYWSEMCRREGKLRHYEKGDYFLYAGNVGRYIGFIKSGTLKYVATDGSGNEHIINLEFPGEFVADFPDSLYNIPSKISIIADSPSEIFCFPTTDLRERMRHDRDFEFLVAKTVEHLFRQIYGRLIESYTINPKQRYEQLITDCPTIFDMFQLKDIASFLRITPGHLSRLRKEIKNKPA